MAVPKQRKTKSRRDQRRRNIFIKSPTLVSCKKCNQITLPYVVCENCGYYKGVEVINVLKKLEKKDRKLKERQIQAGEATKNSKVKKGGDLSLQGLSKK